MLIQQVQLLETAIKRLQMEERALAHLPYIDSTLREAVEESKTHIQQGIVRLAEAIATVKESDDYLDEYLAVYGPTTPELVRRAMERAHKQPALGTLSPINSNHRMDIDVTASW